MFRLYLNMALDGLPRVLVTMIDEYAQDMPHVWQPFASKYSDRYRRIVSTRTVDEAGRRWRIDVQFDRYRSGRIWTGVSSRSTNDLHYVDPSRFQPQPDRPERYRTDGPTRIGESEFLVESHECPSAGNTQPKKISVYDSRKVRPYDRKMRRCRRVVLDIAFTSDESCCWIQITDPDDTAFRLIWPLPNRPISGDKYVWRPSVVLAGYVTATILPSF